MNAAMMVKKNLPSPVEVYVPASVPVRMRRPISVLVQFVGDGQDFLDRPAEAVALPELERDMIHQRTMAGLAAARAQGRVGGRSSWTPTNSRPRQHA